MVAAYGTASVWRASLTEMLSEQFVGSVDQMHAHKATGSRQRSLKIGASSTDAFSVANELPNTPAWVPAAPSEPSAARPRRRNSVVHRDPRSDHCRRGRTSAHAVRLDDVATGRSHPAICRGSTPRDARRVRPTARGADRPGRCQPSGQRSLPGCAAGGAGRASRRVRQPSAPDADDDQRQARRPAGDGAGRVAGAVRAVVSQGLREYLEHKTAAVETQIDELHKSSRRFDEQAASIVAHINETVAALSRRMDDGDHDGDSRTVDQRLGDVTRDWSIRPAPMSLGNWPSTARSCRNASTPST